MTPIPFFQHVRLFFIALALLSGKPGFADEVSCEKVEVENFTDQVGALLYSPLRENDEPIKNIVIFPPTVGNTVLDRRIARKLCQNGMRVVLMKNWNIQNLDTQKLNYIEDLLPRGQAFLEETKKRFQRDDSPRFGMMGISLGGFIALQLKMNNPDSGRIFLMAVGDEIEAILSRTNAKPFAEVRANQMRDLGIPDVDAYQREMTSSMTALGKPHQNIFSPDDFLLMIPQRDTAVPTKNQLSLWESLERPQVIEMPFGHVHSIAISELIHSRRIVDFFQAR